MPRLERYRRWVLAHPWRWAASYALVVGVTVLAVALVVADDVIEAILYAALGAMVTFVLGGVLRSSRVYRALERRRLG